MFSHSDAVKNHIMLHKDWLPFELLHNKAIDHWPGDLTLENVQL